MRKRLVFVAGIAVGYVLGARAGRPAYDAVAERFHGVAESPTTARVGERARRTLEDRAPTVADVAEKATSTVSGAAAASDDGSEPTDTVSASSDAPSPDSAV